MLMMRAPGSRTVAADAPDARLGVSLMLMMRALSGILGASVAIPLSRKNAAHRRHGGVGGTAVPPLCAMHKASKAMRLCFVPRLAA